jgi:hypothetical protein
MSIIDDLKRKRDEIDAQIVAENARIVGMTLEQGLAHEWSMNLYFVTFPRVVPTDIQNAALVAASGPEEAMDITNDYWFNKLNRTLMTVKLIGTAVEGTPATLLCWADYGFNDQDMVGPADSYNIALARPW